MNIQMRIEHVRCYNLIIKTHFLMLRIGLDSTYTGGALNNQDAHHWKLRVARKDARFANKINAMLMEARETIAIQVHQIRSTEPFRVILN